MRVYSGSSGRVRATTHNYVPVTLVDVRLDRGARFEQDLPLSYNAFLYVLAGDVRVGDQGTRLTPGQVGWLDAPDGHESTCTSVQMTAAMDGARLVVYAGERQNVPIVVHGPFVGETRADLMRLSRAYIEGKMPRISELSAMTGAR